LVFGKSNINYFTKSLALKDKEGNNPLHFAYSIVDPNKRQKYLKLLLEQGIGDSRKRNLLGYLPNEMQH
jgi:hypothetical protein